MHLDWAAFRRDRWPVRVMRLKDRAKLRDAFTCFRLSAGRVDPHFLHWLLARNMPIFEVEKRYSALRTADRDKFDAFEQLFREQGYAQFAIPAYGLANDRLFVLDGNHRCVALARCEVPFEITVYKVAGPLIASACGDVLRCRDPRWLRRSK
jgi:hypothetical protein